MAGYCDIRRPIGARSDVPEPMKIDIAPAVRCPVDIIPENHGCVMDSQFGDSH
jgi:hypothetical protein